MGNQESTNKGNKDKEGDKLPPTTENHRDPPSLSNIQSPFSQILQWQDHSYHVPMEFKQPFSPPMQVYVPPSNNTYQPYPPPPLKQYHVPTSSQPHSTNSLPPSTDPTTTSKLLVVHPSASTRQLGFLKPIHHLHQDQEPACTTKPENLPSSDNPLPALPSPSTHHPLILPSQKSQLGIFSNQEMR